MRAPNFSPPPPAQRFVHTDGTLPSSSNEKQSALRSFATERKRQERAIENEEQRVRRLSADRQRKASARQNEDELQRSARLAYDRRRQQEMRENEDESQRNERLAYDRQQKDATRAAGSVEQTHERIRSVSARRRNRSLESKNAAKHGRLQWPRAIPEQQKDRCLQHFVNQTSMSTLKQAVCAVCNVRTYVNSLHECDVNVIPNQSKLHCYPDLLGIIPGTRTIPRGTSNICLNLSESLLHFRCDLEYSSTSGF